MWRRFRRIRCRCIACGHVWNIPRRRILRVERFFDIKKGERFVWICQICYQGVVIPDYYVNSHKEEVNINPENLEKDIKVLQL